ncbi:MAG TPA: hypothetical protein EYQ46_23600 [Myxococcales bacterium]|nr:hypothetical protein [Myxococcales bacterium]
MNGENPYPVWARDALICVGLFLAGALLAFGYSYRPLHGALSWQVEQLEERLDERNLENVRLSDALAKQKSNETIRIDPETLAQVERELVQTKRVLNQAEKDLKRAERKRKESAASASKWRKRFEDLRDQPASVVAAASTPTKTRNPESVPAAPAVASSDPSASPSSGGSQASPERGMLSPVETTDSADP